MASPLYVGTQPQPPMYSLVNWLRMYLEIWRWHEHKKQHVVFLPKLNSNLYIKIRKQKILTEVEKAQEPKKNVTQKVLALNDNAYVIA